MKKVLQKFSQFYKNLPIAKKMATTIIFILAFFLCTVTGLITVIFSKMLISNNSEASNRNLELVRLRMNDLFVNTEMNSGIVVSNYYIQKALNTSNYYTRYQYEPLIRSILDPMTISKSYISSIVIYCNDGYAIASSNVNYSDASLQSEYTEYAPTMDGVWNKLIWDNIHDLNYEADSKDLSRGVSLRRNIISSDNGSIIGFAVLNVNEKVFSDLYTNLSSDDGMQIMILDFDGNIISASGEESDCAEIQNEKLINWIRDNKTGSRCFYYNDQNYLINVCYIERFDWYLISLHPLNILLRDSKLAAEISLALGGILMIIAFIFVSYQSKAITLPLRRLSQTVDEVANGNLNIYLAPYGMDEVGHLTMNFNNMVLKMKTLLNQTFFAEKKKREYEMQALQAQINPHFLYNTLDSIIWMIRSEEYDGAGEMVSLLAKFFRISLSQGKDMIPLKKELEHATSYLAIQNIRFKDKFEFQVNADPNLLNYLCPKLSIQPLLENAIYHGMEGMYEDGEIEIRIYEKEGAIKIEVADNGPGMTAEKLDYIMHNKVISSKRGSGIGVRNVNERIQLIYGKNYGITIASELDEGTVATITIPKMEEFDET